MSAHIDYDEMFDDDDDRDSCPTCGGDGITEYMDDEGSWGEDCPSEVNHLVTCSNCRGSGLRKDCSTQ